MSDRLTTNRLGEVRGCDCGGANLTLGPLTIHLRPREVRDLNELVTAAVGLVDEAAPKVRRRGSRVRAHGTVH